MTDNTNTLHTNSTMDDDDIVIFDDPSASNGDATTAGDDDKIQKCQHGLPHDQGRVI